MTSVSLRIALLKQADVHCQLATAQETPEGDPSKAIEHYLTAMELLTCAVADLFQLCDGRAAVPEGCDPPAPPAAGRPPCFASPLSEVYLQSVVQHKLKQYEDRVHLLMEVVAATEAEEEEGPAYTAATPYAYSPVYVPPTSTTTATTTTTSNHPVATAAVRSAPSATSAGGISAAERERSAIEAANLWKLDNNNNANNSSTTTAPSRDNNSHGVTVHETVPPPTKVEAKKDEDEEDIQAALEGIDDIPTFAGPTTTEAKKTEADALLPAPTTAAADTGAALPFAHYGGTDANTGSGSSAPRQAFDAAGDGDGGAAADSYAQNKNSVTRRFGQSELADADDAFENIFNQFLEKKE